MGRVFRAYYTKPGLLDETGKPRRFYSKRRWTIEYTDSRGRTVHRAGGEKPAEAKAALVKAESEIQSERNGLPTRSLKDLPCAELATTYLNRQRSQVTPKHLANLAHCLNAVLAGVRAVYLLDLTPDAVEGYLSRLADSALATRTVNTYLQAVKGCLNWAVATRRIPFNPLDSVKNRSQHEPRRKRRPLSEDECARLLRAGLDGPAHRALGMYRGRRRADGTCAHPTIPLAAQANLAEQGRRNALIYELLIATGLRVGELRHLAWPDLDLETISKVVAGK